MPSFGNASLKFAKDVFSAVLIIYRMSVVVDVIVLAREILLYIGWRCKRGRLVFRDVYDRGRLIIINRVVIVRQRN